MIAANGGVKVATVDELDLFKVPVSGIMTSTNVLNACRSNGMRAACYDPGSVDYNCVLLNGTTKHIFTDILYVLCNEYVNPLKFEPCLKNFPAFRDIFAYMANYRDQTCGTCGVDHANSCTGFHCGQSHSNLFALCAKGTSISRLNCIQPICRTNILDII